MSKRPAKIKRDANDILIVLSDAEERFRQTFFSQYSLSSADKKCTVCSKILDGHIFIHPALRVIVCCDCLLKYDNVLFKTNEDGTDSNCRWCTQVANKKRCFYCTCVFCENCLERNLGRDFARKSVQNTTWKCFVCDPKPIWKLRAICTKAMDNNQRSSGSNLNNTEVEIRIKTELIESFINEAAANKNALQQTLSNTTSSNEKATSSTEKETDDEVILSDTYKNNVHEKLIETQKELWYFINIFAKEIKRFEKKFEISNLVSYEYIETMFSKLGLLCDKAGRNVECIKNRNKQRFLEVSSERMQCHVSIKKETVVDEDCDDPIITSNLVKTERADDIEENNIDDNEISVYIEDSPVHIKDNSIDIDKPYILQPNLSLKKDPSDIQKGSSSSTDSFNDFLKGIPKSMADDVNRTIKVEKIEDDALSTFSQATKILNNNFETAPNASETFSSLNDLVDDKSGSTVKVRKVLCDKTGDFFSCYETVFTDDNDKEEHTSMNLFNDNTEEDKSRSMKLSEDNTEKDDIFFEDIEVGRNEKITACSTLLCEKSGAYLECYETTENGASDDDETIDFKEYSDCDFSGGEELDTPQLKGSMELKPVESEDQESMECDEDGNTEEHEYAGKRVEDHKEEMKTKPKKIRTKTKSKQININDTDDSDAQECNRAFNELLSSDVSDSDLDSSSDSTSSLPSRFNSPKVLLPRLDDPVNGYIKNLDIGEELAKLSQLNDLSTDEDVVSRFLSSDQKLLNCRVLLENEDFSKRGKLMKKFVKNDSNSSDEEENEIRHLTDLSSLNKSRRLHSKSDDSSTDNNLKKRRVRPKKMKRKTSDETKSDSSDSISFIVSSSDSDTNLSLPGERSVSRTSSVREIFFCSTDDEACEEDNTDNKKKKRNKAQKSESEDKESNKEIKAETDSSDEDKTKWKKDKLLRGNLNMSDSDATNDSVADVLLKKQEEKYLKDIDKANEKAANDVTYVDSNSNDDSDSDCQIVGVKRKLQDSVCLSSDEETVKPSKKGRRNIRSVIEDDCLEEETKKADKEEVERKVRLQKQQRNLETILSQSQLSEEEIGLVLDADTTTLQPLITIHPSLIKPLKPHQIKGIKFMWDVCYESVSRLEVSDGTGCILAHCMGLGKTMQVVILAHTLLTHPVTKTKHILIVCPLSTVFNWKNEFTETLKSAPKKISVYDLRPDTCKTFNKKMFTAKQWQKTGGVLILSYEAFQALSYHRKRKMTIPESYQNVMLEALVDPGPDLVVCDEGHMLKNGKSNRFKSLSKIKSKRRIILTGTPLQNNLMEYYYMVNFVKPRLLGTYNEYANRFVNPIMNGQYEDSGPRDISFMKKRSHILHKTLESTVQRFEDSELLPYLPKKFDYVLFVKLSPLQIKLYQHYLEKIDEGTKVKSLFQNFHNLQNIWTHPALLNYRKQKRKNQKTYDEDFVEELDPDSAHDNFDDDDDWFMKDSPADLLTNIEHGSKMKILMSIIKECEQIGEKLLVFSSCLIELDLIEYFLGKTKTADGDFWTKDLDYYRMDGSVTPEKRIRYCKVFSSQKKNKVKLFLVSHKVGGLGLNLIAASRVVLMDVSWNPAYDTQSIFRVYRFGQERECYIYRLVSMGTMEEVVYSRAVTKLAISCRVVDEQQITRHFKSDDLQRMYSLNTDFSDVRSTPILPTDRLLAKLWRLHDPELYKFCDHQSLLQNLTHEELNEEEIKLAWEEFRLEEETEKRNREDLDNLQTFFHQTQQLLLNGTSSANEENYKLPLKQQQLQKIRQQLQLQAQQQPRPQQQLQQQPLLQPRLQQQPQPQRQPRPQQQLQQPLLQPRLQQQPQRQPRPQQQLQQPLLQPRLQPRPQQQLQHPLLQPRPQQQQYNLLKPFTAQDISRSTNLTTSGILDSSLPSTSRLQNILPKPVALIRNYKTQNIAPKPAPTSNNVDKTNTIINHDYQGNFNQFVTRTTSPNPAQVTTDPNQRFHPPNQRNGDNMTSTGTRSANSYRPISKKQFQVLMNGIPKPPFENAPGTTNSDNTVTSKELLQHLEPSKNINLNDKINSRQLMEQFQQQNRNVSISPIIASGSMSRRQMQGQQRPMNVTVFPFNSVTNLQPTYQKTVDGVNRAQNQQNHLLNPATSSNDDVTFVSINTVEGNCYEKENIETEH